MVVLTGLRYSRSRVRIAKTGQRVRLTAVVPATVGECFNLTHPFGEYARVHVGGGAPRFAWSSYPTPPFEHETPVAGCEGCTEPRFCWDPRGGIRLIVNNGGVVQERISYDHGYTWEAAVTRFASGSHPDIAEHGGRILRAAYVSGVLSATRQDTGDASPGSPFTLKDASAVDLTPQDDSFRIVGSSDGCWWLHARLSAGATTLHYSTDAGATWAPTDGAVSGITSGTHPGMLAAHDGVLYAWARVGTALHLTRRRPGETAWSTPAAVDDDSAVDLSVTDNPHSIAHAYEGPDRLVLAAMITGESVPSDWHSADRGASFGRFP